MSDPAIKKGSTFKIFRLRWLIFGYLLIKEMSDPAIKRVQTKRTHYKYQNKIVFLGVLVDYKKIKG